MPDIERIRPIAEEFFRNRQLLFATSSGDKAMELRAMLRMIAPDLDLSVTAKEVNVIEPQPFDKASLASGLAIVEISQHKALQAFILEGRPVLVEDTSWGMPELKGAPGPLVKWDLFAFGNDGLCRIADQTQYRRALASTVFSVAFGRDPELVFSSRGDSWGWVAREPRGDKGFGWDPIHIPGEQKMEYPEKKVITLHEMVQSGLIDEIQIPSTMRTYGEMESWEKNEISMRMMAARGVADFIRSLRMG